MIWRLIFKLTGMQFVYVQFCDAHSFIFRLHEDEFGNQYIDAGNYGITFLDELNCEYYDILGE